MFQRMTLSQHQVAVKQPIERIHELSLTESGAHFLSQRGIQSGSPAQGHLIILHSGFIQPQNADIADMVMPTGIDAARYFDVQGPSNCSIDW